MFTLTFNTFIIYTPKLYNNDNYESLDILVYEYW